MHKRSLLEFGQCVFLGARTSGAMYVIVPAMELSGLVLASALPLHDSAATGCKRLHPKSASLATPLERRTFPGLMSCITGNN